MADPRQKTGQKRPAGMHKSGLSTQTYCFIPLTACLAVRFGYSVSVIQGVVLAKQIAHHFKQLA
jgi:hypothetical protein